MVQLTRLTTTVFGSASANLGFVVHRATVHVLCVPTIVLGMVFVLVWNAIVSQDSLVWTVPTSPRSKLVRTTARGMGVAVK